MAERTLPRRRRCRHTRSVPHTEGPGYVIWRCTSCGHRACRAEAQTSLFSRAEAQLRGTQLDLFAA